MSRESPRVNVGPSIFEVVRANLGADGRLLDVDLRLPSEPSRTPGGLEFAPGAVEGIVGSHLSAHARAEQPDALLREIRNAAERPSPGNLRRLLRSLESSGGALEVVESVREQLLTALGDRADLQALGRWLTQAGTHRHAVKIGITILGATGIDGDDAEMLRVIGAHAEFTRHVAVALDDGRPSSEGELWELAKVANGWGRIECVRRLCRTENPAIADWILRTGFRNEVMNEYLAGVAAETGDLAGALNGEQVDRELLDAAGDLLVALVSGGPSAGLRAYDDGAAAVESFLRVMRDRADRLGDLVAVISIREFLDRDEDWEGLAARGWTATRREVFEDTCDGIIAWPEWDDRVRVALLSDDRRELWQADVAARIRGIDTYDMWLRRLDLDPLAPAWHHAWEQADTTRAEELVHFARARLPLDELAMDPASVRSKFAFWRMHSALEFSLTALRDHVGIGGDLLLLGLGGPAASNRRASLHTLSDWPFEVWPDGAVELVETAAATDPESAIRELAREVLRRGR